MNPGTYIYAKHNGMSHYPAKVCKSSPKFVWFWDDDGKFVKLAKTNCMTQEAWAKENIH